MERRLPLRSALRGWCVGCMLLLAACVQAPQGGQPGVAVAAPPPPASYTVIGQTDTGGAGGIDIAVTGLDGSGDKNGDLDLSLIFGVAFGASALDATPADHGTSGSGSRAANPIVFSPPVDAAGELDAAVNLIAKRYPDRKGLIGTLYRSPEHAYLVRIEFATATGANALYFDVTRWVAYRKQELNGG